MKAFLLAAGHGTRLRPITDSVPKCLVPIRGMPMLEIWLQQCRRAGITELLINLHAQADIVRKALAGHNNGLKVNLFEEEVLQGSAGTLLQNRDWVASEPEFWVLYADVLTNVSFSAMLRAHRRRQPVATIGLYQVADPTRCGIVAFDESHTVTNFVEKPKDPVGNWAFSGLMIATPQLLDEIPVNGPSDLGFHVLPKLAGRMLAYPISDYLVDIGTMDNYQSAQINWPGFATDPVPSV